MSRPLKILITDPHLGGGGQVRYVTNLARELTRLGQEVSVGCKSGSILAEKARQAGCMVLDRFGFQGGVRPRSWLGDLRVTLRYIQEQRPDILHVNGSADHWVGAWANQWLGSPVCLLRTRHNTYTVPDHIPNRVLNRRWTDYQIVVCHTVRETLEQQRAFDPQRMCSIHNGVDAELFRPDPQLRTLARREFAYTDEHLVCGIAARLVPAKGHEYLFRAAHQLRSDWPQLRVLVLGEGSLEAELRRLSHELGLEDRIHFAGYRHDMHRCVQAFDIGVQPSIDCDTSSFSLKEQMAEEKPVVASDYGGLPEIVADGKEGLVVPAGQVEPLAHAIKQLAASPQWRAEMGQAGRRRVLQEFTVQVFAQKTLEAYHRALEIHAQRWG